MESQEGNMQGTSRPEDISTRLQRIAKLAKEAPEMVFTTLAHHIDIELLQEAHRRTRKNGAAGVDGLTAEEYEENLQDNLQELLNRFKSGTYKAPPVKRVHIPKGDGKQTRPIGIPTFEDKVLQRAVAMILEAVYEQDFLNCSYGYRPSRSPHGALDAIWEGLMAINGGWVVEIDIKDFFGTLNHNQLRSFLDQRVCDGIIRRTIDKWLKAGVLENGQLSYSEAGTPQGGVVSPSISNIYLHEVMDKWFGDVVLPRLEGKAYMVRFADDSVP
jgi:RNA-directed DNA polymerase